jgi:NAD(P)-dependent dehydrogenase (short-subunit alcohol dehydrogenase family)
MKGQHWTTDQIPDLNGKVIIVTGSNTGIGFQAAREFSRKGAETILACRNEIKAIKAIGTIKKEIPEAKVRYLPLDLGSLRSVQQFAENIRNQYSRLDVLLNNAGIILFPYRTTEDGFESHLGINHLGHFALTGLLLDLIVKTDGARVINVSSLASRAGKMDFENFQFTGGKGFSRFGAYGRSKLANLLFTYELDRKFKKANIHALAVAAHPGYSYTDLGRWRFFRSIKYIFFPIIYLVTQNPNMGALPSVRAAVDPEVKGGEFFGPGGRKGRKGFPVRINSDGASYNIEDANKLWKVSEELTGIRYL